MIICEKLNCKWHKQGGEGGVGVGVGVGVGSNELRRVEARTLWRRVHKRAIGAHVEFYREKWKYVFLLGLSLGLLTVYFLKLLQHWVSTLDFEFIFSFIEFVYRLYEKIRMNQYC
jgi:hypothetical protein